MSANFANPTLTSTYANFVTEVKERDTDLALGFDPAFVTPTNLPTNAIRWSSAVNKWQKWNGTAWGDLTATFAIAISGNAGTATTLTTARTINGVSFNGSANISVNNVAAVTFNNAGIGAASGTTFDGGTAQTISFNSIGALGLPGGTMTGKINTVASAVGTAGFGLPHGAAPTTPVNGDLWTTTAGLFARVNAVTKTLAFTDSTITGNAANITGIAAVANGGHGASTAAQGLINLGARTSATGSNATPSGTTAQRDGTPAVGFFRFNTTLTKFEGYNGAAWGAVGGGATGGGSDDIFVENGQTVTTNYSITSGKNAMSAGPVTVGSGIIVTVPVGSSWVIV
jgi:hypothetical protein